MNFMDKFQSKLGKFSFQICRNIVIPQIQFMPKKNNFQKKRKRVQPVENCLKNSAYGRQSISRPMRIVAPMP